MAVDRFKSTASLFHIFGFILVIFILLLTFPKPIYLVTADIGRHLRNGQLFVETGQILRNNYYSYTEPQFAIVNHHWLSGVFYWLIYKKWNFLGLSIFNIFIFLLSFCSFYYLAARKLKEKEVALLLALICYPFLISRIEIRPEMYSYLFFAIFWFSLEKLKTSQNIFLIGLLFVLEMIWVNLHIFFIFGFVLVLIYLAESYILKREDPLKKKLWVLLGLVMLAMCVNPWGIRGALEPFKIFENYSYLLAENQSIVFMQKRFPQNHIYIYYEIVFVSTLLLLILTAFKQNYKKVLVFIAVFIVSSVLAWDMIRAMMLFGFCAIVCGSRFFIVTLESLSQPKRKLMLWVVRTLIIFFIGFIFVGPKTPLSFKENVLTFNYWRPQKTHTFKDIINHYPKCFGLVGDINYSAEFFKRLSIKGPILNNYDIGSYLIFHLFPDEKVFVDNRPEAYSSQFFKDMYVPLQENEDVWRKVDHQYGFNVIYFYRLDMTPWAQAFLIRRLDDPMWAPIYVDNYTLILLRRTKQNANMISNYQLPLSIFKH
jgi:hypothetical protein